MTEQHHIVDVDGAPHVVEQPDDHTLVLPAGTFDADQVAEVASTAFARGGLVPPEVAAGPDAPPAWLSGCHVTVPAPDEDEPVVIGFDGATPGPGAALVMRRANGQVFMAPAGTEEPPPRARAIDVQLHTSPPPAGGFVNIGRVASDGLSYTRAEEAPGSWASAGGARVTIRGPEQQAVDALRHALAGGRILTTSGPVSRAVLATYLGIDPDDVDAVLDGLDEDLDRPGEYSRDAIRRRRAARAASHDHAEQVAATGDILDQLDAAVQGACGCGCGTPIDVDSPSAYFATAECQRRWARTNATDPADVERRPDYSIYTEQVHDRYTSPAAAPAAARRRPEHQDHIHISIGDPNHRAGYGEHQPAAVAGPMLDAWMSAVLGPRMEAILAQPHDASPERVMPVNVLQVAERRFRALFPGVNPAYLSRTLHCVRRQCPDVLGAGYRRRCPACDDTCGRVVPLEYEVTTGRPRDPLLLRFNACPCCWQVLPGPAYRAELELQRGPGGEEALVFRLETATTMRVRIGHVLLVRELYAAAQGAADVVTATWLRLEQKIADQRRPPDAVVAAALAHHAYGAATRDPRAFGRGISVT